ncbi:MAG: HAMP domain-containing histidine kinase [Burkholderiales bacterium]|nr:HAMP domain-containing histidine kinase [Burkholderiales bacterium]
MPERDMLPIGSGQAALRDEITRLNKIIRALMNRVERSMDTNASDFSLFQTAIMLEDQVRERTHALEVALHENEKINFDLQCTKERLEREREEQKILIAKLEQATNHLMQAEKLASLGSLVAGVAHELSTPLGNSLTVASTLKEVIANFIQHIESGTLHRRVLQDFVSQCRDAAVLIERNSQRAADLIGNFKQVAVDRTSMRRRSFDLRQTLDQVASTLHPQFKHCRHRLEIAVEPGIIMESYPGPLEQIIANLASNSLQHGFEGIDEGRIRIAAEARDDGHVVLSYTDNGVGMSEEVVRRAFDPFFTTKLGSGGSGLGLYIIYNLTTAVLGGTIQLDSKTGRGASFTLTLPRVAPQGKSTEEESYAA